MTNIDGGNIIRPERLLSLRTTLEEAYIEAEAIVEGQATTELDAILGNTLASEVDSLASIRNAGRGAALTLAAYKIVAPDQDIRNHKVEHEAGFSARDYDSKVTIPFLIDKSLPRNVETHWLTQTYSFAGPYLPGSVLKTSPKKAGLFFISVVNSIQAAGPDIVKAIIVKILVRLIIIRNSNKVVLTRPKDLPISKVRKIIESHLSGPYKENAPRLPQLVIYAIYGCLVGYVARYDGAVLEPLERLKSADRKRGTIGDVVVSRDHIRIEAVEIKHDQPIAYIHVAEAIDKVRAESVTRYYLLSNQGINEEEREQIEIRAAEFLKKNGCEIIINGITDSLSYYLRLLPNTTEFLFKYANLVENDDDTSYEHRIKWNECCNSI